MWWSCWQRRSLWAGDNNTHKLSCKRFAIPCDRWRHHLYSLVWWGWPSSSSCALSSYADIQPTLCCICHCCCITCLTKVRFCSACSSLLSVSNTNCFCGVQNLSCGKRKKVAEIMVGTTEINKLSGTSPGPFEAFDHVSFLLIKYFAVLLNSSRGNPCVYCWAIHCLSTWGLLSFLWNLSAIMLNMHYQTAANLSQMTALSLPLETTIWTLKSDWCCLCPHLRSCMLMCRRLPAPHHFRLTSWCQSCSSSNPGPSLASPMT